MKAKKTLFTTSGILKIVLGAGVVLIFGWILALSGILKASFLENYSLIEQLVNELVIQDPSYAYLQTLDKVEVINYVMKPVMILSGVLLVIGISTIVFGIFNIIFNKTYDEMLRYKKTNKFLFVIFEFLFSLGLVTSILSTIGVFLREKDEKEPKND